MRVFDDQPVDVTDQHERLGQPGQVGRLLGPPVGGRDHVNRAGSGRLGAAAMVATGNATGAVHYVPGDLSRDSHQQIFGHLLHVLIDDYLGHGHGDKVLGHGVRPLGQLSLRLRPGAGRLVLDEHHEHGAHRQGPENAHLHGYGQKHGWWVPSTRVPCLYSAENNVNDTTCFYFVIFERAREKAAHTRRLRFFFPIIGLIQKRPRDRKFPSYAICAHVYVYSLYPFDCTA